MRYAVRWGGFLLIIAAKIGSGQRATPGLSQQIALADSSVPRIMAKVHEPGAGSSRLDVARDILCGIGRPQARAKLDELADSLTAEAIANFGKPPTVLSVDAVLAEESIAGVGRSAFRPGCTPYTGSYERLIKIHKESASKAIRALALMDLLRMPGERGPALAYIRAVAVSTDPTADAAVEDLIQATRTDQVWITNTPSERADADAILRDLFEHNLVTHGSASEIGSAVSLLNGYSRGRGWVKR
jgi:hypothetical protein